MLFCIDIGNTNTVMGVIDHKDQIRDHWRIRTDQDITSDEMRILVGNLFEISSISLSDIRDIIISCVVPPLLNTFQELALTHFKIKPMIVGPGLKTGMPIKIDNPKEVGADRIVNAVAAYDRYQTALIIVDFGTATTFDCVSKEGAFIGGAIAPGVTISSEALFQRASKLPRVEIFVRPKNAIAKDTITAMNCGIIYGYTGLVDGIVQRMKKEMETEPTVLATGGLAPIICEVSETVDHVEPFLTLEGLKILFKRNK
jgi:type III pantothenate kinase